MSKADFSDLKIKALYRLFKAYKEGFIMTEH